MKKRTLIMTAMAVFGLCAAGWADSGVGVFGSYFDPEDLDGGFGAGVKARAGQEPVHLQVRGTWYEDLADDAGLFDVDLQTIPVDAGLALTFDLQPQLVLTGGGGVSWFFLDIDDGDVDDELGWYAEVGLEAQISEGVWLFGQVLWRGVEASADNDDLDLIDADGVDLDLDGVGVNVGLIFR
jgi:hypothetical protein